MSDCTCYTVISRDVNLLRWCVDNARSRAGIDHAWLVCGWNPTDAILKECELLGVPCVPHELPDKPGLRAHPDQQTRWFLKCLYKMWNVGYEHAKTKWVVRMGSDQFFSKNWLKNLMEAAEKYGERGIYHTWTVESNFAKHSRHETRNWGTSWQEFNQLQFDLYADDLIYRTGSTKALPGRECNLWYQHPARGKQTRPDGVTWLQTKELWEEFGPMEDVLNDEKVTGDVAYMDRLYDGVAADGSKVDPVPGFLVPRSISYHLVQSEARQSVARVL